MKTIRVALMFFLVAAMGAFSAPLPARLVLGGKAVVMVADAAYLFPEARERIAAVGGTDQGLGVFLELVDPGFAAKPTLDRSAGAEAYAALGPDLVVLKSSMKKSLGPSLDAAGISQLYLDLETPDDYLREIAILGETFGNAARARDLVAYYRGQLDRIASKVSSVAPSSRPRVLVVQAQEGVYEVPPASWMQTIIVERAGGIPVWKDANPGSGWAKVGPEQIAAWDPDAILVISYRGKSTIAAAGLASDARLSTLGAVRKGSVFPFPQDFYSWDQPDTRWILGLSWAAKKLCPDRFGDLSILAEAERFYSLCYGIGKDRFESDIRPRITGDLGE